MNNGYLFFLRMLMVKKPKKKSLGILKRRIDIYDKSGQAL